MEKDNTPEPKNKPPQSVAGLLKSTESTSKRTPISQKLIGRENLDDIEFLPIGTEVVGIRKAGPNSEIIKVRDYFISSVRFSMYEAGPLYNLQRLTSDEDGFLSIYNNNNFLESTLVIRNKAKITMSIFCPYRTSIVLSKDKDENKKQFEERYQTVNFIRCSNILDNSQFILPGEAVYVFTNEERGLKTLESVEIDKDHIVSYRLKGDASNFYVTSELSYNKSLLLNSSEDIEIATCEIIK